MKTHVAFLRAINVAGHAIVKMTDLKNAFSTAGCKNVETLIQSGNVIFEAPDDNTKIFDNIRAEVRDLIGTEPGILFRTIPEIERIVKAAPFKAFEGESRIKLYVVFLSEKPRTIPTFPLSSPKEALEVVGMKNLEAFIVSRQKPNGFFGFPNNFIEKELRVSATSRNWSTVTKIVGFARKSTSAHS